MFIIFSLKDILLTIKVGTNQYYIIILFYVSLYLCKYTVVKNVFYLNQKILFQMNAK